MIYKIPYDYSVNFLLSITNNKQLLRYDYLDYKLDNIYINEIIKENFSVIIPYYYNDIIYAIKMVERDKRHEVGIIRFDKGDEIYITVSGTYCTMYNLLYKTNDLLKIDKFYIKYSVINVDKEENNELIYDPVKDSKEPYLTNDLLGKKSYSYII